MVNVSPGEVTVVPLPRLTAEAADAQVAGLTKAIDALGGTRTSEWAGLGLPHSSWVR
ncbi:hypothetical protein ABZ815_50770 [Nonomuraea sp. NPDC047529]|uniref:hypothetical protein n=1 Tax=Nonomuraea sp. NPDC047529 TaxID=3155623 RepID=UPI0033D21FF3